MIISFEIHQTLETILKECKTSKYWSYHASQIVQGKFILQDKDFSNSWADCIAYDNRISITTAWGGYTYHIEQKKDGRTIVSYNGPVKGFLQQSLLPRLTPINNIYEVLVYSTKEGWIKFRNYLDKRGVNLYFETY